MILWEGAASHLAPSHKQYNFSASYKFVFILTEHPGKASIPVSCLSWLPGYLWRAKATTVGHLSLAPSGEMWSAAELSWTTYSAQVRHTQRYKFGTLKTGYKCKVFYCTLSLPRIINFACPLQPHQKYLLHHTVWKIWLFIANPMKDDYLLWIMFIFGRYLLGVALK